jgi:5,10-methylenetetrahydromethanopterin reductase
LETQRIEVGTAVVPTFPRHPATVAQQALTAQAAARGRFTLGIGLSHAFIIEDMFGFSWDKPAHHMREYLAVLTPLLAGQPAVFQWEHYRVNAVLHVPGMARVPLLVAALGPVMLRLSGRFANPACRASPGCFYPIVHSLHYERSQPIFPLPICRRALVQGRPISFIT